MVISILKDLIQRYDANKNNIPMEYREFFAEYINCIRQQQHIGQSKGDRKFTYKCFKPPLKKLLQNQDFKIYDEVDLYKPEKKIPFLNNVVKNKFSDFKKSKKIDLVAIRNGGIKKIIFIEVKMYADVNSLLSGLFELGMIDRKKIPNEFDTHLILLSGYTNNPEKYGRIFNILREVFIVPEDKNKCQFVLLDSKDFYNELKFHNEILS